MLWFNVMWLSLTINYVFMMCFPCKCFVVNCLLITSTTVFSLLFVLTGFQMNCYCYCFVWIRYHSVAIFFLLTVSLSLSLGEFHN